VVDPPADLEDPPGEEGDVSEGDGGGGEEKDDGEVVRPLGCMLTAIASLTFRRLAWADLIVGREGLFGLG
jgi:hypothetical protein